MIIDNFGSTEDAITGYRVITRKKATEFHFEESIVVLKDNGDGYDDYKQVYITKVMRDGELTGLPPLQLRDRRPREGREREGEEHNPHQGRREPRGGAKLHLDQVMEIVYNHPDLLDFVMIYHPLSPPENPPRPKVVLRVAYSGAKPAGIEDEVRELIYEANNPVRYEVEESRQAELIIEAVPPLEKLREGLPTKPGKTKRIYVVGRDL